MAKKTTTTAAPKSTIDIIKDPVTGNQYSRDTAVQGSTYAPYVAPKPITNTVADTKTKTDTSFTTNSDKVRNKETQLTKDINDAVAFGKDAYGGLFDVDATKKSLQGLYDDQKKLIEDRYKDMQKQGKAEIGGINDSFDEAKRRLQDTQARSAAKQSVSLANIGGYLGTSASGLGAMRNLEQEHAYAVSDIEAKRAAAIRAAQQANAKGAFELANSALEAARGFEESRRKADSDFFNNSLSLAKDIRSSEDDKRDFAIKEAERFMDYAIESDEEIDAATLMSTADSLGVSVKVLEGALNAKRSARALEQKMDKTEYDIKLLSALSDIPKGSYVNIGGTVYEGMDTGDSGGGSGKKLTREDVQQLGLPLNLIGKSQDEVISAFDSYTPPSWFTTYIQGRDGINYTPDSLRNVWDEYKQEVSAKAMGSEEDEEDAY